MGYDEDRQLVLCYDVGHCESLAAAGNAHQGLEFFARAQAFYKPLDCLRLVAGRGKLAV